MRQSTFAVAPLLTLVATLVSAVPYVAAESAGAKVVIIVGATHDATAGYRADADEAYAEAIKYTPNVVKVYSPNATWANVKSAVAGASLVIYMGHGNGSPSPYPVDPGHTRQDGFGLNATEGNGDYNNVYYGEPYVSTLNLAPGAVVILNHLCYAAGNSEPGYAEPTVSVARQRVDNYAAGFLKAGAAAVLAESNNGLTGILRDLFTISQPIETIWAGQSRGNGNIVSFPSVRTPGATAFQDPQTPTSGFYRSLVVRSAGTIVGIGTGGGGGTPPPNPVDPGPASVPPPNPVTLSPAATIVPSFSPNGDGYQDTVGLTAATAQPGSLAVAVRDAEGTTLKGWTVASSGPPASITWDGRDAAGLMAPDGRYVMTVAAVDAAGGVGSGVERTVSLVAALERVASSAAIFYPQDLDRLAKTTTLSFELARPMTVTWTVRDATTRVVVEHLAGVALPAGTYTWSFDGRRADGAMLPPGTYASRVEATDGALTATQSVAFEANAFLVNPSDITPGRGQTIKLTVTSAEPLSASPRVSVYQPGVAIWSAALTRVSGSTYRATITLRTGGRGGTVAFKVVGTDSARATQRTTKTYPLH